MKYKQKLKNPDDFKPGTRVKIPIPGKWLGSNKRFEWFKGSIIEVGSIKSDGKIHTVFVSIRRHKDFGHLGIIMCQSDKVYKVKKNIMRD